MVPFPPGGGTDVLARMIAERLRPLLGQAVVIENRPGATGNIGNDVVAKSPPDGHTVLIQGTIIGMFPHIFSKLSYDPLKDLLAVGTIAESANVIVVSPASPFNTLQDLLKAAKADPSKQLELRHGRRRLAAAPGHGAAGAPRRQSACSTSPIAAPPPR